MSRATALARLAAAYGRHQVRRRLHRPAPGRPGPEQVYAEDRLFALTPSERDLLPGAAGCINCGLCALVAARVDGMRPPDLAAAYLRDYPALGGVRGDWSEGGRAADASSALAAAAAACPTGVPLVGVAAMVRRLAST